MSTLAAVAKFLSIAVMGVDPGVEGGVSVLDAHGVPVFTQALRPDMTETELKAVIVAATTVLKALGSNVCYFEKVGYIKGDGGKGAFTFGQINGLLRGLILMAGVNIKYVPPMLWQARMECLTGGQKNISKNKAQELFPTVKCTHAISDSLLIAEYGRRQMAI